MQRRFVYVLLMSMLCGASSWALADGLSVREQAFEKTADAVHAFNRGDFVTAQSLLEDALAIDDTVCEAHFWLARIYAMRAGTDNWARTSAIEHFRCGFELNPYGEMGQLLRAWMYKLMGRPSRIGIYTAEVKDAEKDYSNYETERLLQRLEGQKTRNAVLNWRDESMALSDLSRDYACSLSHATDDHPAFGWIALVGVYDYSKEREKDNRIVRGKATIWITDTILGITYDAVEVSASSYDLLELLGCRKDDTWDKAYERYAENMIGRLAGAIGSVGVDTYELELCNEMLVPVGASGVFARGATGGYANVCHRPLLAIAIGKTSDCHDEDKDIYNRVVEGIQRPLIQRGDYNVVSEGNMNAYVKSLPGIHMEPETMGPDAWGAISKQLGASVLAYLEFRPVDIRKTIHFLKEKIRVETEAELILFDANTGECLHSGPIKAKREKTMWGPGNDEGLRCWAAGARKELAAELTTQLTEDISANMPPAAQFQRGQTHVTESTASAEVTGTDKASIKLIEPINTIKKGISQ